MVTQLRKCSILLFAEPTNSRFTSEVYQQLRQDLHKQGYSKAVDIWSIGCIAGLLLTSELLFPDAPDEIDADESVPDLWDVSAIDNSNMWRTVGRKAKSFVKGCLELDEVKRLTAKQALIHPWFTNKHYAMEIEAAYERAIRDWRPREQPTNIVEIIDTSNVGRASTKVAPGSSSHYFQGMPPPSTGLASFRTIAGQIQHPQETTQAAAHGGMYNAAFAKVPALPKAAMHDFTFASPFRPTDITPLQHQPEIEVHERFSIEDFAPPLTQSFPALSASDVPTRIPDSLTQSYSMLDEHSPMILTATQR